MKMIRNWGSKILAACLALGSSTAFATISNLTFGSDATNAQYAYSYTGTPRFLRIYLDTDRVTSTGYNFRGIGADYMIENGYLFKYSGAGGGGWAFTILAPVSVVAANQRVSWSVPRASMGNPSALKFFADVDAIDFSAVYTQTLSSSSPSPTPTPTPTPAPTSTWTKCADEGGTCNFTGSRIIRYGAQSSFVVKTLTGPVSCSNATFGDPLVGVQKYCELSSDSVVQPTPTPTPTPTPAPADWIRCATENGTCSFSGTRNVRYGVNGTYAYKVATGSIACNNATFGDPVVGLQKFCDYSSSTVASPTPTPTPAATPATPTPTPTPSSGNGFGAGYGVSPVLANPKNPLNYGAKGDGVTDNTAAFQATLNAGDLLIPAGTYIVQGSIKIPPGRSVQCASPSTVKIINPNVYGYRQTFMFTATTSGSFSNCYVAGASSFNSNGSVVYDIENSNFLVGILDWYGPVHNILIVNNVFENCHGNSCVTTYGGTSGDNTNHVITYNTFRNCGYYAASVDSAYNNVVSHNHVTDCALGVENDTTAQPNSNNIIEYNYLTVTHGNGVMVLVGGTAAWNLHITGGIAPDGANYSSNIVRYNTVVGNGQANSIEILKKTRYPAQYYSNTCINGCFEY